MTTLKFKPEKLVHALVYFSMKGVKDLTKLKAAKLLYFADKEHLLRYGRPILGDVYFCLPYGPIPSVAMNEMDDAIAKPEVDDEDADLFQEFLEVKKGFLWQKYPRFEAKKNFDEDVFSDSEIEVLHNVTNLYGSKTARKLVDLTHQEPTWAIPNKTREPKGRARIPYELFFEDASPEALQMLKVFRAECHDEKEFDSFINQKPHRALAHV